MIGSIARQEMRSLLRDGRLPVLGLVLAALFAATLAIAAHDRNRAERERAAVEASVRRQWDHQGDRNPHRAAHFGLYAFKPRSALASLDPGVDARLGQALWLEPHKRSMAVFAPAADAAPSVGLGALTPAFVLTALVPLLIIVVGHGSVVREREQGTLRMLHAGGIRGIPLVLGKWLGLCAAFACILGPTLGAGAWAMLGGREAAAAWPAGAALASYWALWAAATMLVSVRCRSSRVALLSGMAVWLAGIFLIPRLAASSVELSVPLPDGAIFWAAIDHDIEHGLPGDGSAAQRMQAFDRQLLADHGATRLEDLPFGANAKRRLFRDAYATRVHALHFGGYWDTLERQQRMLRWRAFASPYTAMQGVVAAFSGTGLAHRRHFEEAAEAYRQRFTTLVDEWDLAATRGVTSFEVRYAGNAQWQSIPRWDYHVPGPDFARRAAAADAAVLLAWMAVLALALLGAGRRIEP